MRAVARGPLVLWALVCCAGAEKGVEGTDSGLPPGDKGLCPEGEPCALSADEAAAIFLGEDEGGWAGMAVGGAGDLDGDGHSDLLISAVSSPPGGVAYLVLGPADGQVPLANADATLRDWTGGLLTGLSLAGAGDLDGDGHSDLLVGAMEGGEAEQMSGIVYLVNGPILGEIDLSTSATRFPGLAAQSYLGSSLVAPGDVNGDGVPDLVLGAPGAPGGPSDNPLYGAATLLLGPFDERSSLAGAAATIRGANVGSQLGQSLAGPGDVDGDGLADVLVGAFGDLSDGDITGSATLLLGPWADEDPFGEGGTRLWGQADGDFAGFSVAGAGDVDGDGLPDLLVGAHGESTNGLDAGAAYLVLSPPGRSISLAEADCKLLGPGEPALAGVSVAGPGDVNGDGHADLLVGAPGDYRQGRSAGAAYLVYGPRSGIVELSAAELQIVGAQPGDTLGYSVAGAGDVDGDGLADLLLGAYRVDAAEHDAGAAYLFLGGQL